MSASEARDLRAFWFGDDVSLIGHLHTPRGAAIDLCAVICPAPFGYDNVCGHRGLRILGDRLASSGIAALRFDFPGTGDSDGAEELSAWKKAVATAVATARHESGCTKIAIVGVGLGGAIALGALDQGLDVDKLILWGAPARARAWLREQRAYQKVAELASATKDPNAPKPPPDPPGIEVLAGFPMHEKLAAELSAFELKSAPPDAWPASRARPATLVVTRTISGDEKTLTPALEARALTATVEQRDGFNKMFDQPHLSIAPLEIFALMRDWLAKDVAARAPHPKSTAKLDGKLPDGVTTRIGHDGLIEETVRYKQGQGGLLFSIETRPVRRTPNPTWLILLTGRAVRHIGPNRIWVKIARELALKGFASLRLDGRSVGDSDGEGNGLMPNEEYYQEHIYDDIENVMEIATAQGAKQFLLTGICSGATASYQIAWRRKDVRAIVLLNLLQLRHDAEDDDTALYQQVLKFALRKELWLNPESYRRLWKGKLPPNIKQAIMSGAVVTTPLRKIKSLLMRATKPTAAPQESYIVRGYNELAAKPVEIDVFLSDGDLSVNFIERHFGPDLKKLDRRIRVHRVYHADHTLRPLHAQEHFFEVLRAAVDRIAGDEAAADPSTKTRRADTMLAP
ncbi:MAG TPA: alpha/beta fold hydrolase [Polyangia bacterium]|jgi:pimeloyl-ACP methyl ester carboxylesterase